MHTHSATRSMHIHPCFLFRHECTEADVQNSVWKIRWEVIICQNPNLEKEDNKQVQYQQHE